MVSIPHPSSSDNFCGYCSPLEAALAAWDAGLSPIPIRNNGSKEPDLKSWKDYQTRQPTLQEIHQMFANPWLGLALVCGYADLECLDFDHHELLALFVAVARAAGLSPLVDRVLSGYQEESPKGDHTLYRCTPALSTRKLAERWERDENGKILTDTHGDPLRKTLIETRTLGAYVITAPSCGRVHASGRPYRLLSGDFSKIVTVSPVERMQLHQLAKVFNEIVDKEEHPPRPERQARAAPSGNRPGDIFNRLASWSDILAPRGWVLDHTDGEEEYWTRPKKDGGTSGTANYQSNNLFYVFSTSTVLEAGRSYNKFSLYAHLHHGGDFVKAAAALRALGYGAPLPHSDRDALDEPPDDPDLWNTPREAADDELPDPEETSTPWTISQDADLPDIDESEPAALWTAATIEEGQ
jgi:putative DNA primase/helicase